MERNVFGIAIILLALYSAFRFISTTRHEGIKLILIIVFRGLFICAVSMWTLIILFWDHAATLFEIFVLRDFFFTVAQIHAMTCLGASFFFKKEDTPNNQLKF